MIFLVVSWKRGVAAGMAKTDVRVDTLREY